MKGSFKLHEHQAKKKEEDFADWIPKQPCCVCNKTLGGPYGRHMEGDKEVWVCSATCERIYDATQSV